MFERLRKTFRQNKRLWMVVGAAFFTSLIIIWGVYGGFSLGFSQFFASESACPLTPQGNTIVKPVLSVECGPSQNVLTWTNTEAIEAVRVELSRNAYIPAPILYDPDESTTLTSEFGCTGTLKINSYVDTTARPDLINNYVVQVGGPQGGWTNVVSCTPAPTPTATPASVVSAPGANAATLSVQCGTVQNVLTWTLAPGRDSNAILRNVDGADATYVCGGPTGIAPCNNLNVTTFTDTVQAGHTYAYAHKSCAAGTCRSNSVTCSAVTPTPTATTNPVLTPTPTATSCASLYSPVTKCYSVHACVGRSDAVCGATFATEETPGEIGYGVYYGFEDVYKAADGTVYWFNWRTKSPPETDPTKWTWAKIPTNPQAWCASPAQGVVSVQAPTTNLHTIFDAQAKDGRFGCAVAKVGAYNNTKNEANIDCPAAEKAYYACRASLNDNASTPTPTPAPTVPSSPPPPTAGTLTCTPQQQTISVGGMTEHSAQGGDGVNYRWEVSPGAVKQDGVSNFVIYSWLTTGVKSVTVTSGGDQATCIVNVQDSAGAAVTLTAAKEVRNVTAGQITFTPSTSVWKNQAIEFSLRIAPTSGAESGPYLVTDSLPSGMTYMAGSTLLNGGPFDDPTQTADGLVFPPFPVALGTAATLEYRAMSDRFEVDLSPPESRAVEMTAVDQGSGSDARAAVTLILYGRGPAAVPAVGGPGTIPTGPGDAVTFALIAAAVSSLLYAAYTRSAAFRSREVRRIERDQGPMDFRS